MNQLHTVNPSDLSPMHTYTLHSEAIVQHKIEQASTAFHQWRQTSFDERRSLLMNIAAYLEDHLDEFAHLITQEMGKKWSESIVEVQKCALTCRYYAEMGESLLQNKAIQTEHSSSYVAYRPLGVILAVMPWNYPLWQVIRFAAPTLMAGNTALLKHASNVPGTALRIEKMFDEINAPKGIFQTLLIRSDQVASVLKHNAVRGVSLTGSGPAGASVASVAGQSLKPSLLELGGSDPYIILADADLGFAAEQCVLSRLTNAGQSCIGAKRFIAMNSIYDSFLEHVSKLLSLATFGDPYQDVTIGPLARVDLRDEVHKQVTESVQGGARLVSGGYIPDRSGAFYPPTLLADVAEGMPAFHDEIFGPVASVIRAQSEDEAIEIANQTSYGLGGGIFTSDIEHGKYLAEYKLEAGNCFVNKYVRSDPRLPFGGIKASGYGRELGAEGIRAFTNVKTIVVK